MGFNVIIVLGDTIDVDVVVSEGSWCCWRHGVAVRVDIVAWVDVLRTKRRISLRLPIVIRYHFLPARALALRAPAYYLVSIVAMGCLGLWVPILPHVFILYVFVGVIYLKI